MRKGEMYMILVLHPQKFWLALPKPCILVPVTHSSLPVFSNSILLASWFPPIRNHSFSSEALFALLSIFFLIEELDLYTILFLFLCFLFLHVLLNTFKNTCNFITSLNVLVVLLHKNGKYSMWNLNFVKLKEIRKKLWIIEFQNGEISRRIKKWENYFCDIPLFVWLATNCFLVFLPASCLLTHLLD